MREHLGDRPVTAVIYTHSHLDHFGGLAGVADPDELAWFLDNVVTEEWHFEHDRGRALADMVPERIDVYPTLPKTSTGKIDRRALPTAAAPAP